MFLENLRKMAHLKVEIFQYYMISIRKWDNACFLAIGVVGMVLFYKSIVIYIY